MTTHDRDPATEARHAAMRDMVMTWEEITSELIFDREGSYDDLDAQPITLERREEFCRRFPHFADRIREYVERWNREPRVTEEMLAAVEIPPDAVEKGFRRVKQIIDFYDKLRRVEKARDGMIEAGEALAGAVSDLDNYIRTGVANDQQRNAEVALQGWKKAVEQARGSKR